MPSEFVHVRTTHDDEDAALELIRAAVGERLAACGQLLGPIRSVYWWRNRIDEAEEWICIFKTTTKLAGKLEAFIEERHSYEVPEIVVTRIARVSESYGDWIRNETRE